MQRTMKSMHLIGVVLFFGSILGPTGQDIRIASTELAAGNAKAGDVQMPGGHEAMFGAVNILLCFAALFVAVIKPRFGKAKS